MKPHASTMSGPSAPSRTERVRSIASFALGPILGLASGPILARALEPEGRGQFAAIMQPISVAGAVASIGVPAAMTFFVARGSRSREVYLSGLLVAVVPATLVYFVMLLYAIPVSRTQGLSLLTLAIAWFAVVPSAVVQIRRGIWQGLAKWRLLDAERAAFAIVRFLAVSVLALVAVRLAEWYAFASLLAFIFTALILFTSLPARTGVPTASTSTAAIRKYSLAASAGTIALIANNRIDQVIFPAAGSQRELGFYAVAVTVAEVPIVLGTLAARNALTEASRGASLATTFKSVRLYVGLGVLLSATLAILSPYVVPVVFGDSFASSSASVTILCTGTIFSLGALVLGSFLTGTGQPAKASLLPVAALIVTAIGFITFFGSITSILAAYIALISQVFALFVGLALCCVRSNRTIKLQEGHE